MRITYETGIATFVQFVVLSLLNIATVTNSIITTCHSHGDSCLTNSLSSVVYYLLIVVWFGVVWQVGYRAQLRRSRRLCQLLILVEGFVALIAIFNARHHNDTLGLIVSALDASFAIWVIYLATRLLRARGGRIVASERSRRRRHPNTDL